MDELVQTKLKIQPGIPLFGTVLLPCDLIVYLYIDDELLLERTNSRKTDFENAKKMQRKIENEIANSNIETIVIEVNQRKKYYKR